MGTSLDLLMVELKPMGEMKMTMLDSLTELLILMVILMVISTILVISMNRIGPLLDCFGPL